MRAPEAEEEEEEQGGGGRRRRGEEASQPSSRARMLGTAGARAPVEEKKTNLHC